MLFYVGTYTNMGGPGVAVMQLRNQALSIVSSYSTMHNPSYVILSKDRSRLFAVGEGGGAPGCAAVFMVNGDRLSPMNRVELGSVGPCHLCLSPDERFLYAANYVAGSISVISVQPNCLGEAAQTIQHSGSGGDPSRQKGPHAHHVSFLPGTNVLCVVDLGLDAVMCYQQDPDTGLLRFISRLDVESGLGPRHLAFSPKSRCAYLAHELGNAVSVLSFSQGQFETVQTLPTLPAGYNGRSYCGAIRVSASGKRVYVSNRGHDSLAVFTVGEDGTLAPRGHLPVHGEFPRDFALVDEAHILVANQNSGDITLLRDEGDCATLLTRFAMPAAVCVCL